VKVKELLASGKKSNGFSRILSGGLGSTGPVWDIISPLWYPHPSPSNSF